MYNPYTVSLFPANTGQLSARLDHENGTFIHLHSLVDPECDAEYFSDITMWGDRIILAGCGLGYHLKKCCTTITPDAKILLIEYHDELAVPSAELISSIIGNELTILTGSDEQWEPCVKTFLAGGRYVQTIRHPPSFHAHKEFYESILAVISSIRRSAMHIKNRSILLMQGDFFAERELLAAANTHGLACTEFRYKENSNVVQYESNVQKTIQTLGPEMILSINMLGIDMNGVLMDYARHCGIPVIIWFVDDPRPIILNRKKLVSKNMAAFTWERAYVPFLRNYEFASVNHLPLAADPAQFRTNTQVEPSINFGFIGSSMGKSFLEGIAGKFIWKPCYEKVGATVAKSILEGGFDTIDILIEKEIRMHGSPNSPIDPHTLTWLRSYCIHYASMMKRQQSVAAMQPLGIELFGDPDGWKHLCGSSLITHPDLDYRSAIADTYRSIAVNINITSCQMPTAVNQRVFDVPLCERFLLNDNQADLELLFAPDEYEVYHTIEELPERAAFFNAHDAVRKAIASRASKRIQNEHTYWHRLQKMMAVIKQ